MATSPASETKSGDKKQGDWTCPSCGELGSWKKKCRKCGTPNPKGASASRSRETELSADAFRPSPSQPPQLVLQEGSAGVAAQTRVVGGHLAAHAPAFSTNGTRIFVPCGTTAFCYSVKTVKQTGALAAHQGQVTGVCAGPSDYSLAASGCAEPLASCSAAGELRLWDSRTLANLGNTRLPAAALSVRWPRADAVYVVTRMKNQKRPRAAQVVQIDVSSLTAPKKVSMPFPIQVDEYVGFDAVTDVIAIADGRELCVWVDGWPQCRRFKADQSRAKAFTTVAIDPLRRYVTVGDDEGAIWTWWGILDSCDLQGSKPAKFQWHANPVRALAHCGPIVLSGGFECVLCYRRSDNDTPQFVPRLPAPILHIAASSDGFRICLSMADNSIALVQDLHSWVVPRYIQGIALPAVDMPAPVTASVNDCRSTGLRRPVLHPLAKGTSFAATGNGQRVQFFDSSGSLLTGQTLTFRPDVLARSPGNLNPEQRWTLWQVAISSGGKCIMTVERRLSPALHKFDSEYAESYCVKWWRRAKGEDAFVLDSTTNNPHIEEVTVALSSPQREQVFITASLDGQFKRWDWLPMDPTANEEDDNVDRCWQLVTMGSWHSRPILTGTYCMDGSVLALGYHGFVVLYEPRDAVELQTLPLGDEKEQPSQLACSMGCGCFLLIVGVKASSGKERIQCWDLVSFQMVAQLDLSKAVPGIGRCAFRISPPREVQAPLGLLLFREVQQSDSEAASKSQLQAWRLEDSAESKLGFKMLACASLPKGSNVLDACFRGSDDTRVLCWMSNLSLWDLDLATTVKVGAGSLLQEADGEAGEDDVVRGGKAARLVGGITTRVKALDEAAIADGRHRRLVAPQLRTTAAQQAGVLPKFLGGVLPAHVPSHLLPPPAILFSGMLSVFAKAAPGAEQPGLGVEDVLEKDRPTVVVAEDTHKVAKVEMVDAAWMDKLVQDALTG